jgi:hypothetical protein
MMRKKAKFISFGSNGTLLKMSALPETSTVGKAKISGSQKIMKESGEESVPWK